MFRNPLRLYRTIERVSRVAPRVCHLPPSSISRCFCATTLHSSETGGGSGRKYPPFVLSLSILSIFGLDDEKLDDEEELAIVIKRSIILYKQGELNKSEQMLHVALRTAQQLQHQRAITYIYDLLGNLALEQNQLDKAEKLLKIVMQRLISGGLPNEDIRNVNLSSKLARILHAKGDREKAGVGFRWCLKHLEEMQKSGRADRHVLEITALTKIWYARLLGETGERAESLRLLEDACDIMKDDEENAVNYILTLNDIATVHESIGDVAKAEEYLDRAILRARDIKYPNRSILYLNLGRVYMRKRMYEKARKKCGLAFRLAHDAGDEECEEEAKKCVAEAENLYREWKKNMRI